MAADRGIPCTPHSANLSLVTLFTLHLMAALPETALLEFDPTGTAIYEELFIEPLRVEAGDVHVPGGPGLGVRLTSEIIDRWS